MTSVSVDRSGPASAPDRAADEPCLADPCTAEVAFADPTGGPCDGPSDPCSASTDLTWMMHRASSRLRLEFDAVARSAGLGDARDWVVLTALTDGESRTQLELGRVIGVDKTTLMAILDRMEERQLIVRTVDVNDRRVRIPQATPAGLSVQAEVARRRNEQEARILGDVSLEDQQVLRRLLTVIADL